jgi:hypothetical protein
MTDDQIRQVAIRMAATAGDVSTVQELVMRVERFLSEGRASEVPLGIALTAFSTVSWVLRRMVSSSHDVGRASLWPPDV